MDRMLRAPELYAATGKGETATKEDVDAGLMVSGVQMGTRAIRYPESEVQQIIDLRAAGGTDEQVRALVRHLHAERARRGRPIFEKIVVDIRPSDASTGVAA